MREHCKTALQLVIDATLVAQPQQAMRLHSKAWKYGSVEDGHWFQIWYPPG